jgi:hypothetical protein
MPTTIYDSSLITQRRRAKAESGSFISRISPWNVVAPGQTYTNPPYPQANTGYAPALGIWDQSIVNQVKNGNMKFYRKNDGGCTTIVNGCPCQPLTTAEAECCGTN